MSDKKSSEYSRLSHSINEPKLSPRLSNSPSERLVIQTTSIVALKCAVQKNIHSFWSQLWKDTAGKGYHRLKKAQKDIVKPSYRLEWRNVGTECWSNVNFYRNNWKCLQQEILCGIAATLLQIPETIAFSYVANLDPLIGLHATGILAIVIAVLGGVPGTIAGAAGALAVVMPQLTGSSGDLSEYSYSVRVSHLYVAVLLAGIMQFFFGVFHLSKFFSMIPRTAHIGFLNGLAIMMLKSQSTTIKRCKNISASDAKRLFAECEVAGELEWMHITDLHLITTLFTVLATMCIMHFFPKIPRIGSLVPPTLVVAIFGIGFEFGINRPLFKYDVRTIGDTSSISGGFPSYHTPQLHAIHNWSAVISCAASLAAIGIFESIMTLQAIVDLRKSRLTLQACRKESIAQGIGNILCGFFHGMGGCSMIAQSTGNIINGAQYRLSGFMCGITTFIIVCFASPIMELVPVACLSGILFVIIAHTFHWKSLILIFHIRLCDGFTIVLVTLLAATLNLAVAVIAGVIWHSLVNGWDSGKQLSCREEDVPLDQFLSQISQDAGVGDNLAQGIKESLPALIKVYRLQGTLLYSSVMRFRGFFHSIYQDPALVVLDISHCHLSDFSATAALQEVATLYYDQHKLMLLVHFADMESFDLVVNKDIGWNVLRTHSDIVEAIQIYVHQGQDEYLEMKSPHAGSESFLLTENAK
ncbi:hypothetical protein ABG067_007031 [Albugo candida]